MELAEATLLIDRAISLIHEDRALVRALTRFRDSSLLSQIVGRWPPAAAEQLVKAYPAQATVVA